MARSGRRPGTIKTREAILDAARQVFHAEGYAGATIRGIAAEAEVDPALVHHYFGNKRSLFVAAMKLPVDPHMIVEMILEADQAKLGESIVRLFLSIWDSTDTGPFIGLIRSAMSHDDAARMLRDLIAEEIMGPVAATLTSDHPTLRATLVGSHMVGIAMLRYILRLEPIASADTETLVQAVGPTLQRYLTGDLWPASTPLPTGGDLTAR
jgi:AcrR family transcriptional regulator